MKSIEINDLLSYHFYGNLKVKDGVKVFVDGVAAEKENAYEYTLKCVKDDKVYDLTSYGKESDFYIENENSILFCGNRKNIEKSTSLYRLALNGGEAKEIARFDKPGMNVLGYLNENTLVLMTKEKLVEEESDYEVFDEIPFYMNGQGITNKHRTHLYTYNLDTKELVCVTEGTFDVSNAKIHDGALYYTGQNWTRKQALYENLYKYDGSVSTVVDAKERSVQSFDFVDGKLVLIASTHEKYGLNENPKFFDQDFNLIADWQECVGNSVGTDCALVAGNATLVNKDALYFVSTIYDHNNLYKLENGNIELVFEWPGTIQSFAFEDDTLYFIGADVASLQQLYKVVDGKAVQLSDFNKMEDTYVANPVEVNFGENLTGWVLLPKDYDGTKKYPAILDIHGGPKTVYGKVFYHEMQVWASKGYFVFFCNIHGSDGRGNEFMDIRGKYGTIDYDELMQFTDKVLETYPQIDSSRIGVTGGSYGGFMTNWIIGHTDRFCSAASQRSIASWISLTFMADIGLWFDPGECGLAVDENLFDGFDRMWNSSPLKYVENAKTPTLFIHSDEDRRCPLPEGMQMMQALAYKGVDTRICIFHGENHELSRSGKPLHRVRRLKEITNWFDKYTEKENGKE